MLITNKRLLLMEISNGTYSSNGWKGVHHVLFGWLGSMTGVGFVVDIESRYFNCTEDKVLRWLLGQCR